VSPVDAGLLPEAAAVTTVLVTVVPPVLPRAGAGSGNNRLCGML